MFKQIRELNKILSQELEFVVCLAHSTSGSCPGDQRSLMLLMISHGGAAGIKAAACTEVVCVMCVYYQSSLKNFRQHIWEWISPQSWSVKPPTRQLCISCVITHTLPVCTLDTHTQAQAHTHILTTRRNPPPPHKSIQLFFPIEKLNWGLIVAQEQAQEGLEQQTGVRGQVMTQGTGSRHGVTGGP